MKPKKKLISLLSIDKYVLLFIVLLLCLLIVVAEKTSGNEKTKSFVSEFNRTHMRKSDKSVRELGKTVDKLINDINFSNGHGIGKEMQIKKKIITRII